MEKCSGVVVITAIFNDHDKIRQPRNLGPETSDHVCFFVFVDEETMKRLHLQNVRISNEKKIGVWRVVRVWDEELYENPAMSAVIPKHLPHRLFPNSKYSVWVDAKLQLVHDPLLLIDALVADTNVDMAVSRHPHFVHTMEEAAATARWKKWWSVDGLRLQMETYCDNGLQPWSSNKPYPTGRLCTLFFHYIKCLPSMFCSWLEVWLFNNNKNDIKSKSVAHRRFASSLSWYNLGSYAGK